MKRLFGVVALILVSVCTTAGSWVMPEIPEGYVDLGLATAGETAVYEYRGDSWTKRWIEPNSPWGPVFPVYSGNLVESETTILIITGQGTGGYLDKYGVFIGRCYPETCEDGGLVIYAPEGWVRVQ